MSAMANEGGFDEVMNDLALIEKEQGISGMTTAPANTDVDSTTKHTATEPTNTSNHGKRIFAHRVDEVTTSASKVEVVTELFYEGNESAENGKPKTDGNDVPNVSTFKDHLSLPLPSSVVRYRNSRGAARVIEGGDFQFVLEEHDNPEDSTREISIRRIEAGGQGLKFLRSIYGIVTAFWTGFLFVFSMQLLLFLFLDLAIQLGITEDDSDAKWFGSLGVLFGIPPLIHGLASGLVLGGAFVVDALRGHYLIRNLTFKGWSTVIVEWLFFSFFLGLPILVMCVALLLGTDDWWPIAGISWVCSIAAFFVSFCVSVVFYEMRSAFEVMKNISDGDDDTFWSIIKRAIVMRQVAAYSGKLHRTFISRGTIEDAEYTDKKADNLVEGTISESISWRAKINNVFVKFGWFEKYPAPRRFYSVEDARDVRPFITSHTWSLERMFCRSKNSRYIAIIKGSGAVTRAQMKSSLLCSIIGSFLVFFVILAILVYLEAGTAATCFLLVFAFLVSFPNFKSTYRLYSVAKDIILARTSRKFEAATQGGDNDPVTERDLDSIRFSERERDDFVAPKTDSEGLYLVDELYRVNRPTNLTAWILFYIELTLIFLWPTVSLFFIGNWPLAISYAVVVGVSGMRHYLNAAVVMEEVGHMNLVDGESERELWRNQSRLNEIVGNISRGRSRTAWVSVISFFTLAFLALFAGAVGSDQEKTEIEDPTYHYMQDYMYSPIENSLRYPTCQLTSDLQESPLTSMADYIFLARVAYRGNITQSELDNWFGNGVAVDQAEFVDLYREENNINSAVEFKLITYPTNSSRDFAYLAIRGTTNEWEALTDAQLWSGAMLMQVLREFLPFGSIWSAVMPFFIRAATSVESHSIEQISFYQDTVQFTNFLKEQDYAGVAVTGHSLGGGLSMITGAQAHVPSVALSGPNTVLTRKSLDPPISMEELDRYTFNIIPERDLVPLIDDPAQNFQKIRCNADFTDVIGCHDTTRALCEAIYTCGSDGRPIPCECVSQMGFPEPQPVDLDNKISFVEACDLVTSS